MTGNKELSRSYKALNVSSVVWSPSDYAEGRHERVEDPGVMVWLHMLMLWFGWSTASTGSWVWMLGLRLVMASLRSGTLLLEVDPSLSPGTASCPSSVFDLLSLTLVLGRPGAVPTSTFPPCNGLHLQTRRIKYAHPPLSCFLSRF